MFQWDGTDVSDIISRSDIYEAEYGKNKYWIIQNVKKVTCLMRNSKSTIPCLIDELKPVFGLQKLGTHWCKQGGKIRILIKCVETSEGHIKEELSINKLETYSPLIKLQIQEIFAFRELLGVTCSYSSNIIIRECKNNLYPISFYEPNMLTTDTKIIPFTVLEKWFNDSSIDFVVKRLCKIHSLDRLSVVLHNLRNSIEETIDRVDRRLITYKSCIINRITERLQTTLTD